MKIELLTYINGSPLIELQRNVRSRQQEWNKNQGRSRKECTREAWKQVKMDVVWRNEKQRSNIKGIYSRQRNLKELQQKLKKLRVNKFGNGKDNEVSESNTGMKK